MKTTLIILAILPVMAIACGGMTKEIEKNKVANAADAKPSPLPEQVPPGTKVTECTLGNKAFKVGGSFMADCNSCECTESGAVCTKKACSTSTPGTVTECQVGDTVYKIGETWGDGCNGCSCTKHGAACTTVACIDPKDQSVKKPEGYDLFGQQTTCYSCTGSACPIPACAAQWGGGTPFATPKEFESALDAWMGRCNAAKGDIFKGECGCNVCSVAVQPYK